MSVELDQLNRSGSQAPDDKTWLPTEIALLPPSPSDELFAGIARTKTGVMQNPDRAPVVTRVGWVSMRSSSLQWLANTTNLHTYELYSAKTTNRPIARLVIDAPSVVLPGGSVAQSWWRGPRQSDSLHEEWQTGVWVYTSHFLVSEHHVDANLKQLLRQLIDLLREEYEEDDIKPSPYTFEKTYELLVSAREYLPASIPFPRATVSANESGSIFVFWRDSHRKVHLVVPSTPDGKMYIYHEDGDAYAVDYNVTGQALANWLKWYVEV